MVQQFRTGFYIFRQYYTVKHNCYGQVEDESHSISTLTNTAWLYVNQNIPIVPEAFLTFASKSNRDVKGVQTHFKKW